MVAMTAQKTINFISDLTGRVVVVPELSFTARQNFRTLIQQAESIVSRYDASRYQNDQLTKACEAIENFAAPYSSQYCSISDLISSFAYQSAKLTHFSIESLSSGAKKNIEGTPGSPSNTRHIFATMESIGNDVRYHSDPIIPQGKLASNFNLPQYQPRLSTLISILTDYDICLDDIEIDVCKPGTISTPENDYILVTVNALHTQFAISDRIDDPVYLSNQILGLSAWSEHVRKISEKDGPLSLKKAEDIDSFKSEIIQYLDAIPSSSLSAMRVGAQHYIEEETLPNLEALQADSAQKKQKQAQMDHDALTYVLTSLKEHEIFPRFLPDGKAASSVIQGWIIKLAADYKRQNGALPGPTSGLVAGHPDIDWDLIHRGLANRKTADPGGLIKFLSVHEKRINALILTSDFALSALHYPKTDDGIKIPFSQRHAMTQYFVQQAYEGGRFSKLSDREKFILFNHYLVPQDRQKTLSELATDFGMCVRSISLIRVAALDKLEKLVNTKETQNAPASPTPPTPRAECWWIPASRTVRQPS